MNLYELTNEYLQLANGLDESDEPTESTLALLAELEADIANKADGYCSLIRHYEAHAKLTYAESERIEERGNAADSKAKWLKKRLMAALQALGETKLKTPFNTITIAKNGGKQPLTIEINPQDLPDHLRLVEYKPNLDAIRINLEAGQEIPGCTLQERGQHVRLT